LTVETLIQVKCSPFVIEHSKAVLNRALGLSSNFDVDRELLEMGALLHDIGRSKTNDIYHGIAGAEILKDLEFSKKIMRITERHIGAGIPKNEAKLLGLPPKDYMPVTLEEKIVAHADNLVHGTKQVDIDFVVKKWKIKLGKEHPSIRRLIKLHNEVLDVDNHIKIIK